MPQTESGEEGLLQHGDALIARIGRGGAIRGSRIAPVWKPIAIGVGVVRVEAEARLLVIGPAIAIRIALDVGNRDLPLPRAGGRRGRVATWRRWREREQE